MAQLTQLPSCRWTAEQVCTVSRSAGAGRTGTCDHAVSFEDSERREVVGQGRPHIGWRPLHDMSKRDRRWTRVPGSGGGGEGLPMTSGVRLG